ncbi:MAG: peroxisome- protein [Watsoniomyces obsoletus]|nr:MAG: peroxisome- protein [Watsoniomyces obsoletus]
MSSTPQYASDGGRKGSSSKDYNTTGPPTRAVFSPASLAHAPAAASRERSSILVQQKSPLLATTPPQITRTLAYSHPFLLQLNRLVGWLSWTTDDPWESFLLLAAFWGLVLYGDQLLRWGGPLLVATGLVLGIYARRFSPLLTANRRSSESKKGKGKEEAGREDGQQHKSLDEIVETLQVFTSRCNILADPCFRIMDQLSSSQIFGAVLIRLACITPIWIVLAYPALGIISTKRVVLIVGTVVLGWHSRAARVSRAILWRSRTIRYLCVLATGIPVEVAATAAPEPGSLKANPPNGSISTTSSNPKLPTDIRRKSQPTGIRFTFTLWENQRRWIGLGWTHNLFAYERAPWTDEHLNPVPSKDEFRLPEVDDGHSLWRWVEGNEWRVEGAVPGEEGGGPVNERRQSTTKDGVGGWIYYDSKWRDGRRQDGWGRYTRRRKWYRDAELVEVTNNEEEKEMAGKSDIAEARTENEVRSTLEPPPSEYTESIITDDNASAMTSQSTGTDNDSRRRKWFKRNSKPCISPGRSISISSIALTTSSSTPSGDQDPGGGNEDGDRKEKHGTEKHAGRGRRNTNNDDLPALSRSAREGGGGWGVGDDARMSLG